MRLTLGRFAVVVVLSILGSSVMTTVGCRRDRDDQVVATADPQRFVWTGDFYEDDGDQTIAWTSTLSGVVRIEIKGSAFQGSTRIRVYDGAGAEVYDEDFSAEGPVNFRETDFSAPSVAGSWLVRIGRTDVSGDLRVIIDPLP